MPGTMVQNKTISTIIWIACLTIAAYLLAQSTIAIMSRNFQTGFRNMGPVAQSRPGNPLPLPAHPATARNRSVPLPAPVICRVKVTRVSDTRWILDRPSLRASMRNMSSLLMQARAVPFTRHGKTTGLRISSISPGSLFEKIGLRNGDLLIRVNRRNLNDPAKYPSLFQEMRNKRHISLFLSRYGQNRTFDYDIR